MGPEPKLQECVLVSLDFEGWVTLQRVMGRGCKKADSIPGRGINRSNFSEPGSETER